jgi:hypothetical protein
MKIFIKSNSNVKSFFLTTHAISPSIKMVLHQHRGAERRIGFKICFVIVSSIQDDANIGGPVGGRGSDPF